MTHSADILAYSTNNQNSLHQYALPHHLFYLNSATLPCLKLDRYSRQHWMFLLRSTRSQLVLRWQISLSFSILARITFCVYKPLDSSIVQKNERVLSTYIVIAFYLPCLVIFVFCTCLIIIRVEISVEHFQVILFYLLYWL